MKKLIIAAVSLLIVPNICFTSPDVAKVSWVMNGCEFTKKKNICQKKYKITSFGSSVYLGGGLFITAAHVIDFQRFEQQGVRYKVPAIELEFQGKTFGLSEIPVRSNRLLLGEYDPSYGDIAILKSSFVVKKDLKIHKICKNPEIVGDYGVVSTIHGVKNIRFLARQGKLGAYDLVSQDGDSGGGVFQSSGCLAGIISRKYPDTDPHMTLFTPYEFINKSLAEANKIYKNIK